MKIIFNNHPIELISDSMTVAELLEWKKIPSKATAVAVNSQIVKRDKWESTHFSDGDNVMVISGTFGG